MTQWTEERGGEPGVVFLQDWKWFARRIVHAGVVVVFFALVMLAALPMGANRDWAWAPLCVMLGAIAIPIACGLGSRGGHVVVAAERLPLAVLAGCWIFFMAFGLWQMTTWTPRSGDAWLFERAAAILGHAHAPVPAVAADLARNSLLRCLACALIFLAARAICRDRDKARWLLVALVASGLVVVSYGLAMQVSTHSCYVGSFLKKQHEYNLIDYCLMSGTFVSSNSFACYMGMATIASVALLFSGRSRKGSVPYGHDEEEDVRLIDWFTGPRVVQLAAIFLMLGGMLMSASRAGFAATAVGGVAFGLLLMRGRWRSRPDLGRVFFAGLAVFVVVGVVAGSALLTKFADAGDSFSRLRIWYTSLQAVWLSPWLGWGLGGFADIYTILQPASILIPNNLAHSTPLEVVVELGLIAAIPAMAVVAIPWAICLRGAWRRRLSSRYLPVAAFAIAAVPILHSTIDFSLQMPAIGFVTSAVLGMGWAQAFGRRDNAAQGFTPWE
jgi:O-antigen ligase